MKSKKIPVKNNFSNETLLKNTLDEIYGKLNHEYLNSDPLEIVKRYENPADQEVVAIVTAMSAFGQVQQIKKAVNSALTLMGASPFTFVKSFDPTVELDRWKKWYYRMVKPSDLLRMLWALQKILQKYPSIGSWVERWYDEKDIHLGETWKRCVDELKEIDAKEWQWKKSHGRGFAHLLSDPGKKSACKRVHLLLRWMVRKDDVDLGLWNLPPAKLLIPVDTHIYRLATNIGLTKEKNISLKAVVEITNRLKILNSEDPVKYDFALCRLGILKMCPKKRHPQKCAECPIKEICLL